MAEVNDAMIISILVIVILILLFLVEIYRNLLNLLAFYSPEAAPPAELRFSPSFLSAPKSKVKDAESTNAAVAKKIRH
jgi:hypothetical protein